jgi:hypothetical protein
MKTASRAIALAASLWFALCPPSFAAGNNVVGMVLDLQGPGQISEGGMTRQLQLLASIGPESRVQLPAGSKASVTIYSTRSVYRLEGPVVVEATRDGLTVVQGRTPEVKALGEKLVAAAQVGNAIPGAYRMRSLRIPPGVVLLSPEPGNVLLDTRPAFSWEAAETSAYTLTLQAESGGLSYNTAVSGTRWQLPEGIQLEYGKTYDWKVASVSPGSGQVHSASGKFSLATRAEADQVAALRPADADPIEEWVFYAVVLQQRRIGTEAREAWKRIAARRPDLERATELAR